MIKTWQVMGNYEKASFAMGKAAVSAKKSLKPRPDFSELFRRIGCHYRHILNKLGRSADSRATLPR